MPKFIDGLSDSNFEFSFKCGACAYKFSAGMVETSADGKPFCPRCKEEIVSFPTSEDVARNDYIAHTHHDRFHSRIVEND